MTRAAFAGVFSVVALLATACSSGGATSGPASSTVPPPTSTSVAATSCALPHAAGQFSQSFTYQGVSRTYQLYVPRKYGGARPVPVVFNFHGYGSNAVEQMVYGNFKPEAERDGFVIVAPDGQDPANRHFNLTNTPGLQNDIGMVGALLDHLRAMFCVDARRVYAAGMSDGGGMTSVLACAMSDRFAAFGTVALVVSCPATRPIAMTSFSGTADPVVPFAGGTVSCCGHPTLGAQPAAVAAWAAHDKCSPKYREERISAEVRRRTWTGCTPGSAVVHYIIEGGGHTWPGSIAVPGLGHTTEDIDASAILWNFFRAHPMA